MPLPKLIPIGTRFGTLVVSGPLQWVSGFEERRLYPCTCVCGNLVYFSGTSLRRGNHTTCGKGLCLSPRGGYSFSDPQLYSWWYGMMNRCYNPKNKVFHNYGGRGIVVCAEWHDFLAFKKYVENLPHSRKKGFSIDRKNNNGNYEPGNIQWASKIEQANNRKTNLYLTLNGTTRTVIQWSRILGIGDGTIRFRFRKGWSVEKILSKKDWRRPKTSKDVMNPAER